MPGFLHQIYARIEHYVAIARNTLESRMGLELAYTDAVARDTGRLYAKVAKVIPEIEWPVHAPLIAEINRLKREKNAVILGHNYMTPEIFHCVSDFVGDSLALAREAARTDAAVIVQAGVHFMAETSKILSPQKTVLIPDARAGCSLAASITGADVRLLRQKHPGLPVVTYVNTSADVKAESDICCTSGNAVKVVETIAKQFGTDTVIMIPDQYLARNVAAKTGVKVITWAGACEVHERFTAEEIRLYRAQHPGVTVLAHPECPPDVVAEADFAGSTAAMIGYVGQHHPARVVMITECSMSDNVAVEYPDVEFVRPCNLCPHMKRITLEGILHSLQTMSVEIQIDPAISARAKVAIDRMLAIKA
ncbi:MAG: quinolinate synthase NadA [Proteobacteria bacterium]|nr:quinolinate synthase NadA [Pseudomonadota bacterium]